MKKRKNFYISNITNRIKSNAINKLIRKNISNL